MKDPYKEQAMATSDHGTGPKYPDIHVRLSGLDGNAFAILGRVRVAMRKAKVPAAVIEVFQEEATAGDYNTLLATCARWVNVS